MATGTQNRLVANFSGKVRRVKSGGREYLVAPMTLLNPGVLNGSKGPLLYPPDEVSKNYRQWNGVPIVVYHPHRMGQPVSASAPGVLESQGVGVIRNAVSNGKLQAEGWFDAEKTKRVNPGVYDRLMRGEAIELSTGLFTDNEATSGDFNGRPYTHIARNYRADHLAVLPDQTGACSIQDGCGVLVNKFCPTGEGGGQDNSCGGESKDDRIEGTQAEADREVVRYGSDVKKLKSKLAKLNRPSAKVKSLQERATEVDDRLAGLAKMKEASAARIAGLKAKLADLKHNKENSMALRDKLSLLTNANPEGHNQYTAGGGSGGSRNKNKMSPQAQTAHHLLAKKGFKLVGRHPTKLGESLYEHPVTKQTVSVGKKSGAAQYDDPEENCDEENCDEPMANAKNEDADEYRTVELKTDNPDSLKKTAEEHDAINDAAKSPNKEIKAGKNGAKRSGKAEEENCDTVQNLGQKLSSLVGNWGGPPQAGQRPSFPPKPQGPPQQGPPQQGSPAVHPPMPPQPPQQQQQAGPEAWLAKQLAMLIIKYKQLSDGGSGGPPTPPPMQQTHNQGGRTMANVKLTGDERKTVVDGLINNNECCWEETDREVLNGLNDVTLAKMYKQQEMIANAEEGDSGRGPDDVFKVKNNPMGAQKDELDEDSEDDVSVEEEPTKPSNNRRAVLTNQDRADLAFARRYRLRQRQSYVNAITANANNKFTPKQLASMDDGVLANMALIAQDQQAEENAMLSYRPSFFGQQGAAVVNASSEVEEPLVLGKIDFKELAANRSR